MLINSSGQPVLADFGLSRFRSGAPTTICNIETSGTLKGTTRYMAIEIIQATFPETEDEHDEPKSEATLENEGPHSEMERHTQQSDVWAFGMTAYVSLSIIYCRFQISQMCEGDPS